MPVDYCTFLTSLSYIEYLCYLEPFNAIAMFLFIDNQLKIPNSYLY